MNQQVGRYTVLSQLGRGGMGVVYLAEDPLLTRQVAIKTVDLGVDDPGDREFMRGRLLRDARAAAVLSHPNIVSVHDVLEEGPTAYLVMEYVAGESLAARLKNGTPDAPTTLRILRQMASALDYAHSRGVIHRDIKPGNVMLDASGTAKIMDFGIARISDTRTVTPTGMVMGTVEFMAPEQIKGEPMDGRADQFSLAAVAYQMLTGSTLFGQHTLATLAYKMVNEAPVAVTARNAALPPAVDAVLNQALSKSPTDRYGTCTDFIEALDLALFAKTPPTTVLLTETTRQTVLPAPSAHPAKRLALTLLAAGLAIAAISSALVVWKPWVKATTPSRSDLTATSPSTVPEPKAARPLHPTRKATTAPVAESRPPEEKSVAVPQTETPPETLPEEPPAKTNGPLVPPKAAQQFQLGLSQIRTGDDEGAIQSFTAAIAAYPAYAQAYHHLAAAHQLLEQNEYSIRDYTEALRLDPREPLAYAGLGVCLVRMRRDDEAFAAFNHALELKPDLATALNGRGGVYFRRKQFLLALRDYDAAINANPRFGPAYMNRAHARQAMGDAAGAAADLKMERQLRQGRK